MSRKKAAKTETGNLVIGLLERHANPPSPEEQLARYSELFLGRPVGHVEPVMDEPVSEVLDVEPEAVDSSFDDEIRAALSTEDLDNDYDEPGATVAMEAVEEPSFAVDDLSGLAEEVAEEIVESVEPGCDEPHIVDESADGEDELPDAGDQTDEAESETMTLDAAELDAMMSGEGEPDPNEGDGTVMMGAIDEDSQDLETDADTSESGTDDSPDSQGRDGDGGRRRKKRRHR